MASLLALDAGQTSCRAVLKSPIDDFGGPSGPEHPPKSPIDDFGSPTRPEHQPKSSIDDFGGVGRPPKRPDGGERIVELPALITDLPVIDQLAVRVRDARAKLGPIGRVAIGASALPGSGGAAELLGMLTGVDELWLAHDSITNYLGALEAREGVVVAAGTGVVTLAAGPGGLARVDGWGYLIGDAGSGFWLGRAGLDAVLRAHDGRGPATALSAPAIEEFDDLAEAYLILQNDPGKVQRIARYARLVAELAETDEVCRRLCVAAGTELAHSALTGLARVGLGGQRGVPVGLAGRVFTSAHIRTQFESLLRASHPDAEFVIASGGSLRGTGLLPEVPAGHPLASQIEYASR